MGLDEMGLALTSMGDYEEALDAYNQTLLIDPSNSFAKEKIEGLKSYCPDLPFFPIGMSDRSNN
jgi:tetratricopeptide (TPR) repeat protein